jgi:hypothetical protein
MNKEEETNAREQALNGHVYGVWADFDDVLSIKMSMQLH